MNNLISPSLCEIFNCAIKTKTYPDDFNIANTTPLSKTDDKEDVNNYRPISVIPTVIINPAQFLKQAKTKFKFKQIKVEEVFRVINKLINAKAVGTHAIPNRSLKEANNLIP